MNPKENAGEQISKSDMGGGVCDNSQVSGKKDHKELVKENVYENGRRSKPVKMESDNNVVAKKLAINPRLEEEHSGLHKVNGDQASLKEEAKMESIEKHSVHFLLQKYGGLPPMEMNKHWSSPLCDVGTVTKSLKRKNSGDDAINTQSQTIIEEDRSQGHIVEEKAMQQQVSDYLSKFDINTKDEDGAFIESKLARQLGDNLALKNTSKASIVSHVRDLLVDVLNCLLLGKSIAVRKEVSMLSMHHDVVVVRWHGRIILVVDVANPEKPADTEAVDNSAVVSRAYDHAMTLRQMGVDRPLICLSSYEYIRIGSLDQTCEDIFAEAIGRLNDLGRGSSIVKILPCEKAASDNSSVGNVGTEGGKSIDEVPARGMYFSDIFDRTRSFKAIYFFVVCGIIAVERSASKWTKLSLPIEGQQIHQIVAAPMENSLDWEKLGCTFTYRLNEQWGDNTKVYFHSVLGQGYLGKVFLASDSVGQLFAVKLFLFDSPMMESMGDDAAKSKTERAEEMCREEAEKWRSFYPRYKHTIFELKRFEYPV